MKPLEPAPYVDGNTDWERFDNAVKRAFSVTKSTKASKTPRKSTKRAKARKPR